MVVNYSRDSDYHSQRNNALVPHSSCNATSMIMALKQAGWDLPESIFPQGRQPEDVLTAFLLSEEAEAKTRKLAPWAWDRSTGRINWPPYEIHCVMEWVVNHLLGKKAVGFYESITFEQIIKALDARCGVVLSGFFPYKNNRRINHMVSVAGYMKHQGIIDYLILDDPFGDYQTRYRSHVSVNFTGHTHK